MSLRLLPFQGWVGRPDVRQEEMPSLSPLDRRGLRVSSLGFVFLSPPVDCWRVRGPSLRVHKWISFCGRSLRFPSGGCPAGAVARFGRRGRLWNYYFSFSEADRGVTQSSLDFSDDILIGCEVYEYRCPTVDTNVIGVLQREVAQEAMVPSNSFHGV